MSATFLSNALACLRNRTRRVHRYVVLSLLVLIPFLTWDARVEAQEAVFSYAQRAVAKTELRAPHGVAVDAVGNVYIADTGNNQVLKQTLRPDAGYDQSVVVDTGLSAPQGVAVDLSGNVYIADTGNNRVLKETPNGGAYVQSVVASAGLRAPGGVAVDGSGNVYVADTGNKRVLKETVSDSTYVESVIKYTGLSAPGGIAADAAGNVYIVDAGTSQVLMESVIAVKCPLPSCPIRNTYIQTVIAGTGMNAPQGVAVDERGNVYIADTGNNRVLKETAAGSAYTESVFATLGLSSPGGVAAGGNSVYVADTANDRVLNLDPPANFGSIAVGTTSASQTLVFTFNFSMTLWSTPYAVETGGITGLDFTAAATQPGTACVTNHNYNAGNTCTVDVTFTPKTSGVRYGAVVLYGSGNTVIATGFAVGVGTGPQVTLQPLIESTVSATGFSDPEDVAVDGKNDLYVIDGGSNKIFKETLQADGSYTQSTITSISGFIGPFGIAIDGAGNVLVADTNNGRVMEETLEPNGYMQNVVATGLTKPQKVAVDSNDNVYSAEFTNPGAVLKWTPQTNGSYVQSTVASGLAQPAGIAVDNSGNVYVGETTGGSQRVLKETLQGGSTYAQSVIATGVNQAYGVSVDEWGNVYYVDRSNNAWEERLQSNGSYVQSLIKSGLSTPSGIAVDGNGNVIVSETGNKDVLEFGVSTAETLNFAKTSVGTTSSDSPQTVTLENFGNVALTLPIPVTGNNPSISPTSFTLNSSGGTACPLVSSGSSTAGTLAANATCTLPISFSPTVSGTITGTLVLTDNDLNAVSPYATQTITLNGSAVGITISPSTLPNATYHVAYPQQTLTASGGLTTPYHFSVTSGALPPGMNMNGSGVIAGTPSTGGAYTFTVMAADSTPAGSGGPFSGSATYTLTVDQVAATVTLVSSNNPSIKGQSVTFTATVTNGATGTVTFEDDGVAISGAVPIAGGKATFTTAALSADPAAHPITAVYSGDTNYAGATSAVLIQVVGVTDFGPIPVGSTSGPISVVETFNGGTTLSSTTPFAVLTTGFAGFDFHVAPTQQPTACVAGQQYNGGQECTVDVIFTPTAPGRRRGAVVFFNTSNAVVDTDYVLGTGTGPQVLFLPETLSTIPTSTLSAPSGVAVDVEGDVYISDSNNGRVLKETLSGGSYTESVIVSGLQTGAKLSAVGVVVDGAGNVIIGNYSQNHVLFETLQPNGSYTQKNIGGGVNGPYGVAVDGFGNIYFANAGNANVQRLVPQSNGTYKQTTVAANNGLITPFALATDVPGNLYVADSGSGTVYKFTIQTGGTYVQSTVASGLNQPQGVAIDDNGNVYIADTGNNRVLRETLSGTTYTESVLLSTGLNAPRNITVDSHGNGYVADSGNNRVLKLGFASAPTLNFDAASVGSTSKDSPQTVTLVNFGNAPLTLPIPGTGNNPSISANFTLDSGGSTACPLVAGGASAAGTLAANTDCTLPISFSPTVAGAITGTLVLTDDSLNATSPYATQTINLNGTGVLIAIAPSTLPNGTYGTAYSSQTLTASGGSTAPYTFAVTTGSLPPGLSLSSAGVISGTPTAAGTYTFTITATDSTPAATGGPFTGSASYSVTVGKAVLTVTIGSILRVLRTANPTLTDAITGFVNGDTSSVISGSVALTTTATTSSPPGTYPITFSSEGLSAANYTFNYVPGTLTIVGRSQTTINPVDAATATIDVFGFGFAPPGGTLAFRDTTTSTQIAAPVTLDTTTAYTWLLPMAPTSTGASTLPTWTELGDINGDGIPDLVTSLYLGNSVSVQLGNGDGTFGAATIIPIASGFGPAESHLFSLRGNGVMDLVVASFDLNEIAVLLGNGDGTFQSPVFYTVGSASSAPYSLTAGDFNHDGKLDIAAVNNGDGTVSILLGNGTGTLAISGSPIPVGHDPQAIRAGDFNGDGYPDLVVANYADGTVTTLLNNKSGGFTASTVSVGSGSGSGPQALAITGTGSGLKLAVANYLDGAISVMNSNGDGTFGAQTVVAVGTGPDDVNFANFNGAENLVVTNYIDGTLDLLLAGSGSSYTLVGPFAIGSNPYSAAVGDIDQDGTPDFVVSNSSSNSTGVLVSGTQITVPYSGLSLVAGDSIQATYTRAASGAYIGSISSSIIAP